MDEEHAPRPPQAPLLSRDQFPAGAHPGFPCLGRPFRLRDSGPLPVPEDALSGLPGISGPPLKLYQPDPANLTVTCTPPFPLPSGEEGHGEGEEGHGEGWVA